jgi:hypothetical protein
VSEKPMKTELLALMLRKDFWRKNKAYIIKSMFQPPMDKLYNSVTNYHENYGDDLDKDKLWTILKMDNPTLTDSQKADLFGVVNGIKECNEWTTEFASKVLSSLWKQEVFTLVAKYGIDGAQGKLQDLEGLKELIERHSEGFLPKDIFIECTADIQDLIDGDVNGKKWEFQLGTLQEKIGGLHEGHFLQLMARPDCGKTAFVVSNVAAPGGWAAQGARVDWYVNEEPVKRTRWRCISAFTGLTKEKLIENPSAAAEIWNKIKANVRTVDIPFGTPVEQIAARTRDRKPDIVIVDQLDKLGVAPIAGNFAAETDRIRLLYIKFREIAKRYNCLVVGVCQASADAEGKRIVTYDQAENSKTGKAAECDVFIGIGRNPLSETLVEEDYTRYITVSKNKLDTGWKGTLTCKLRPKISRFEP